MSKPLTAIAVLAAAGTLAGCTGMREALGVEKVAPDEFRVVTTAPLVIPPDYNLRPPAPGETRPQDLRPDAQVRAALFGRDLGANASAGERALVAAAGASATDPTIRSTIDRESADMVRKPEAFADRVLDPTAPVPSTGDPAADAQRAERERLAIERATGGQAVTIAPPRRNAPKLPGT
jgi:hypothetical protein